MFRCVLPLEERQQEVQSIICKGDARLYHTLFVRASGRKSSEIYVPR